tara:strand:+ start:1386 stop:1589 length:204 start_codon:yes stop_codon:yes gene_type:complete
MKFLTIATLIFFISTASFGQEPLKCGDIKNLAKKILCKTKSKSKDIVSKVNSKTESLTSKKSLADFF